MYEAVIVSALRTPMARGKRGAMRHVSPSEMSGHVIRALVASQSALDPLEIDDVIWGTATPEREQGLNIARIATFAAGLSETIPAVTVNRFCASGLQTIAQGAQAIMSGQVEVVIAGGVESMSYLPFNSSNRIAPNCALSASDPDLYLSMGLTAENVAEKYNIDRKDADVFAYESHQKAIDAIKCGRYEKEIVPMPVTSCTNNESGNMTKTTTDFAIDEGPRGDTSIEKLDKLRPVFKMGGQVTAGNASQVSDGAAGVIMMRREKAKALGLTILATYRGFTVTGVAPGLMGIGPITAIPKLVKQTGVSVDNIKRIELNEAFSCQSLAVINTLGLPVDRTNVNGGAIALGHPLGCTGARLTVSIIHELMREGGGNGMVTMCVGGGMGAAGLFEV